MGIADWLTSKAICRRVASELREVRSLPTEVQMRIALHVSKWVSVDPALESGQQGLFKWRREELKKLHHEFVQLGVNNRGDESWLVVTLSQAYIEAVLLDERKAVDQFCEWLNPLLESYRAAKLEEARIDRNIKAWEDEQHKRRLVTPEESHVFRTNADSRREEPPPTAKDIEAKLERFKKLKAQGKIGPHSR